MINPRGTDQDKMDGMARCDVLLLGSCFGEVKIAEPLGLGILASCLRQQGVAVTLIEPLLEGWTVERAAQQTVAASPTVIGISLMRDRHVRAINEFVRSVRQQLPRSAIFIGGHGPSVAMAQARYKPVAETVNDSNLREQALCDGSAEAIPALLRSGTSLRLVQAGLDAAPPMVGRDDVQVSSASDADRPDRKPGTGVDSVILYRLRPYLELLRLVEAFVLGEAEVSFPRVVERIMAGLPWRDVPGVCFQDHTGEIMLVPCPPKIENLDELPLMARDILVQYQHKYQRTLPASLVASRGCLYRCTFCSVTRFESLQVGKRHRFRSNASIVSEMEHLHATLGTTHFNFEDDNFIVPGQQGAERTGDLCDRIAAMKFRPTFSVFCRADAVSLELFTRLRDAGLTLIYFGVESVHPPDLEFFQKDLNVEAIHRALDILGTLGFSASVDSQLRIMLGFVTWHPLVTFEGLRTSLEFVRRLHAPPKLLRRKLRLYSGTDILRRVVEMGLWTHSLKDEYFYRDSRIQGVDDAVNRFFAKVNHFRDRLRTLEKAHLQYGYSLEDALAIRQKRAELDCCQYDQFVEYVRLAEAEPGGGSSPAFVAQTQETETHFQTCAEESGLELWIQERFRQCGFHQGAADLFRR